MLPKPRHLASAVALSLLAAAASAQTIQPGLWENTSKILGGTGQMGKALAQIQDQLAKMSPEERKAMEQATNTRLDSDGNTVAKICITQEIIDRKGLLGLPEGKCSRTVSPTVGNVQKFSFTCTEPPSSAEGTVTFLSKTSYNSKLKMNILSDGKPESMAFEGSNKFLGADCGSVKPLPIAQK